jgi:hypothetical protein
VVDPLLETDNANDSDFQSKIAQQTTDIVLDRKSERQKLELLA